MKPRVSVVIPFYNCPYISRAVRSVLKQTYPNIEIIVVDDGSTQHAELLKPHLNRIYYLGKANGGTASALNHGIRHASGDYIAWLSSDDLFYPRKIAAQLKFMLESGAPVSFTNFNNIDKSGVVTLRGAGGDQRNVKQMLTGFIDGNPVNGCTVMFRKDVFNTLGYFDENLPYTHDYDYWLRVVLARMPFPYLNVNLTAYRWHSDMGTVLHSESIQQEIEGVRHRYREQLLDLISTTPL